MVGTAEHLTTAQAARLLGCSEQTVRALVRIGKLRAVQTPLGMLVDEESAHDLAAERDAAAGERRRARA